MRDVAGRRGPLACPRARPAPMCRYGLGKIAAVASEHLLDDLERRGQVGVQPHGLMGVPGERAQGAGSGCARCPARGAAPRSGDGVPRGVDLRHERDEPLLCVLGEVEELRHGRSARTGSSSVRPKGSRQDLVVGQVQVQHVELVELQQVDDPAHLRAGAERRATSRDRPRQAYLGASVICAAGTRISFALRGRRRGHQLDLAWSGRARRRPVGPRAATTWPASIASE